MTMTMVREELAETRQAELSALVRSQMDEAERAAKRARDRVDVAARVIAGRMPEAMRPRAYTAAIFPIEFPESYPGDDDGVPEIEPVEPVVPVEPVEPIAPDSAAMPVVDFGRIAASIAGDEDWSRS